MPEYGINGFKALLQKAIRAVNEEVDQLGGSAKLYAVFPINANKEEIYKDTRELGKAMGMDTNIKLDSIFASATPGDRAEKKKGRKKEVRVKP